MQGLSRPVALGQQLGLPLGLKAPVMMPNGVFVLVFSSAGSFKACCAASQEQAVDQAAQSMSMPKS